MRSGWIDLESEKTDLGSERLGWGFEKPYLRYRRPYFGSGRPYSRPTKPSPGLWEAGEDGWMDRREDRNRKICPMCNHRSLAPLGLLFKKETNRPTNQPTNGWRDRQSRV